MAQESVMPLHQKGFTIAFWFTKFLENLEEARGPLDSDI